MIESVLENKIIVLKWLVILVKAKYNSASFRALPIFEIQIKILILSKVKFFDDKELF